MGARGNKSPLLDSTGNGTQLAEVQLAHGLLFPDIQTFDDGGDNNTNESVERKLLNIGRSYTSTILGHPVLMHMSTNAISFSNNSIGGSTSAASSSSSTFLRGKYNISITAQSIITKKDHFIVGVLLLSHCVEVHVHPNMIKCIYEDGTKRVYDLSSSSCSVGLTTSTLVDAMRRVGNDLMTLVYHDTKVNVDKENENDDNINVDVMRIIPLHTQSTVACSKTDRALRKSTESMLIKQLSTMALDLQSMLKLLANSTTSYESSSTDNSSSKVDQNGGSSSSSSKSNGTTSSDVIGSNNNTSRVEAHRLVQVALSIMCNLNINTVTDVSTWVSGQTIKKSTVSNAIKTPQNMRGFLCF